MWMDGGIGPLANIPLSHQFETGRGEDEGAEQKVVSWCYSVRYYISDFIYYLVLPYILTIGLRKIS